MRIRGFIRRANDFFVNSIKVDRRMFAKFSKIGCQRESRGRITNASLIKKRLLTLLEIKWQEMLEIRERLR